jgi:hypothetical protein
LGFRRDLFVTIGHTGLTQVHRGACPDRKVVIQMARDTAQKPQDRRISATEARIRAAIEKALQERLAAAKSA